MLSFLLISLACLGESGDGAETATFAGKLLFNGDVPRATIADDAGRYRPLFEVGEDNALVGAVVWLEPLDRDTEGTDSGTRREPAVIDQVDFRFEPQVTAVMRGQTVLFGNADAANHNVRADGENARNQMNIVTPPRTPYEKRFDLEPSGQAIKLHCDVHAWMAGWIYVFDHPWFAVTDEKGEFRIDGIPGGRYRVRIEQPAGKLSSEEEMTLTAPGTYALQKTVCPE